MLSAFSPVSVCSLGSTLISKAVLDAAIANYRNLEMEKKTRSKAGWLVVGFLILCPFPNRIAQPLQVQFVRSDGKAIAPIQLYQSWESYGLWGSGHAETTTDASGYARFSSRNAYGSVLTRLLSRVISVISVHSSYGSRVSIEFTLPPSIEVAFSPTFTHLYPLTSGSYLDSNGRDYFPQTSGKVQRVIVSGDFVTGEKMLRIPLKE